MTEESVKEGVVTPEASPIDRRYPIGPFFYNETTTDEQIPGLIKIIEEFPARFKKLLAQYSEHQLDTQYREGGWTIRQVVHHVADSHMNAYMRFKLAITEDKPTIKPYNEKAWAELIDSKTLPVEISLGIIEGIHARWTTMLKAMDHESLQRTFFHPEHMKLHDLREILTMYAWHSNHHYAHIQLIEPAKRVASKRKPAVKKKSVVTKGRKKKTA